MKYLHYSKTIYIKTGMHGKRLPLLPIGFSVNDTEMAIYKAATETLRQIEEMSIDKETGSMYWPCEAMEKMLYYAATENKITVSLIRDSKIIQDQLRVIRRKEAAADRELAD